MNPALTFPVAVALYAAAVTGWALALPWAVAGWAVRRVVG